MEAYAIYPILTIIARVKLVYIDKPFEPCAVKPLDTVTESDASAETEGPGPTSCQENICSPETSEINNAVVAAVESVDSPYKTDDGFVLSDEQTEVYETLNTTNKNYLITGKAGTGKSVLLR